MQAQGSLKTEQLWTYDDVRVYLRMTYSQVTKLVHFKKIPHVKIGRVVRFNPKEVIDWLQTKKELPVDVS